jgi:hypothetical protein
MAKFYNLIAASNSGEDPYSPCYLQLCLGRFWQRPRKTRTSRRSFLS